MSHLQVLADRMKRDPELARALLWLFGGQMNQTTPSKIEETES